MDLEVQEINFNNKTNIKMRVSKEKAVELARKNAEKVTKYVNRANAKMAQALARLDLAEQRLVELNNTKVVAPEPAPAVEELVTETVDA